MAVTKSGHLLDVREYSRGVGTGDATIDTAAIQWAVDQVSTRGPNEGAVWLPPGYELIIEPTSNVGCVQLRDGVSILGEKRSVVKLIDNAPNGATAGSGGWVRMFHNAGVPISDVRLAGWTLDGNRQNSTWANEEQHHGVLFFVSTGGGVCERIDVEGMHVRNCQGDAVILYESIRYAKVEGNHFESNARVGANITGCRDSLVANNIVEGDESGQPFVAEFGIKMEVDAPQGVIDVGFNTVVGNVVRRCSAGIGIVGNASTAVPGCVVTGNTVEGRNTSEDRVGYVTAYSRDTVISNNVGYYYPTTFHAAHNIDGLNMSGNTARDSQASTDVFYGSFGVGRFAVDGPLGDIVMSNNQALGCHRGFDIGSALNSSPERVTMVGNIVNTQEFALYVRDVADGKFAYNDFTVNSGARAVWFRNILRPAERIKYDGNTHRGGTAQNVLFTDVTDLSAVGNGYDSAAEMAVTGGTGYQYRLDADGL